MRVCVCARARVCVRVTHLCVLRTLELVEELRAQHHVEVLADSLRHLEDRLPDSTRGKCDVEHILSLRREFVARKKRVKSSG